VLVEAGGHPAIVAGTFGKGRVVVVLMNPHGSPEGKATPFRAATVRERPYGHLLTRVARLTRLAGRGLQGGLA